MPTGSRVEALLPSGARLVLPRHQPGTLRQAALIIAAPLILILTAVAAMCLLSAFGAVELAEGGLSRWWFLPFGLFFGMAAAGLLVTELHTHLGRAEIEVDDRRVRSTLRLGPLKWTRECPLNSLTRFNVPESHSEYGWERHGDALVAELKERDGEDAVVLVRHYPNERLLGIAEWLTQQINRERLSSGKATVSAVSETKAGRLAQPLAEQPPESRIRVDSVGDGLVLKVPPVGLLRYGGGVGATCGVMCLGMVALGAVAAFNLDVGLMIGLLALAALIGALTLSGFLYGLNGGLRRTVLTVAPDRLKLEQTAPFGSRDRQWHREDIEMIGLGPSRFGTTVHRNRRGQWLPASSLKTPERARYHHQQLPELRIGLSNGESWGLFAGRAEDELRWLVTVLRDQLRMSVTKAEQDA